MDRFCKEIKLSNIKATSVAGDVLKIIGKVPFYLTIGKIRLIHGIYILMK